MPPPDVPVGLSVDAATRKIARRTVDQAKGLELAVSLRQATVVSYTHGNGTLPDSVVTDLGAGSVPCLDGTVYQAGDSVWLAETARGRFLAVGRVNFGALPTLVTRPAAPVEGQRVYETDTDRIMVWDGAAWQKVWPASILGRTAGSAVTTSGTAESTIFTAGIAAQGYPYRVQVRATVFHTQTVAGDSFSLAIKLSSTIVGLTRGQASVETLIAQDDIVVAGGGAITVNVTLARAAGTGTASTFADGTSNYVTTRIEPA